MVSLIVPIYDVQSWLSRCLESILAQTYKNIQVILVDDGSPDDCPEICDEYAQRDRRVQVIHQENQGLSGARNSGLVIATGRYISFVDSDDWIAPDYVEQTVKWAEAIPGSVVMAQFCRVSAPAHPCVSGSGHVTILNSRQALCALNGPEAIRMVVAWGKVYPAHLFEEVTFPIGRLHEDEFIVHELLSRAAQVVLMETPLYFYFIRSDGIMQTRGIKGLLDMVDALEQRAIFLERGGHGQALKATRRRLAYRYIVLLRYARDRGDETLFAELKTRSFVLLRRLMRSRDLRMAVELNSYLVAPGKVDALRSIVGKQITHPILDDVDREGHR